MSILENPDENQSLLRGYAQIEAMEALSPRFIETGFVGFDPPYGWLELVGRLHVRLLDNPDYRIVQVKEKFGGLRFYTQGLTPDQQHLVRAVEEESLTVCQGCGSRENVELRGRGWVATLCENCDRESHEGVTARGYRQ